MNILRGLLALCLIVWNLQLMLLGFVLVALAPSEAVWCQKYWPVKLLQHFKWKWMWLWDNEEDGNNGYAVLESGAYKNRNWVTQTSNWGAWRTRYVWSAWRNSVNNLRFTALGRSPEYSAELPKFENAFLTSGFKFFLQLTLSKAAPYRVLWFGWKPGSGFKSTITTLDKVGA